MFRRGGKSDKNNRMLKSLKDIMLSPNIVEESSESIVKILGEK